MSLETAIESLAKSVDSLVNVVQALNASRPSVTTTTLQEAVAAASTTAPPAAPQKRGPGRPAKAAAEEPAPVVEETIKYETVREAILKLAETKGHSVAVATLAKFGAKTGKDLKPEQYAAALAACREA